MRGMGVGYGGAVQEILDALPLDSTHHVTDCGYDDNAGRCGCYDLPSKLAKIVAAAKAEALETEADLIGNGTCCPECDGVADMMRDRAKLFRPSSIPPAEQHGMLPGSHERPSGPECRCGAAWDFLDDCCTSSLPPAEQEGDDRG